MEPQQHPASADVLGVGETQLITTIPTDPGTGTAARPDDACARCGRDDAGAHCWTCLNCADECACPGGPAASDTSAPAAAEPPAVEHLVDAMPRHELPPIERQASVVAVPPMALYPFHVVAGALVELAAAIDSFAGDLFAARGSLPIHRLSFPGGAVDAEAVYQVETGIEAQRIAEVDRVAQVLGVIARRKPDSELSDWYLAEKRFGNGRLAYVAVTRIAPEPNPLASGSVDWEAERRRLAADVVLVDQRESEPA